MATITINTEFALAQFVHFTLNPNLKGQIVCMRFWGNGIVDYDVTFLDPEGFLKSGHFYEYELEAD